MAGLTRVHDPALAEPWQAWFDPLARQRYYWNPVTSATSINRPQSPSSPASASQQAPAGDQATTSGYQGLSSGTGAAGFVTPPRKGSAGGLAAYYLSAGEAEAAAAACAAGSPEDQFYIFLCFDQGTAWAVSVRRRQLLADVILSARHLLPEGRSTLTEWTIVLKDRRLDAAYSVGTYPTLTRGSVLELTGPWSVDPSRFAATSYSTPRIEYCQRPGPRWASPLFWEKTPGGHVTRPASPSGQQRWWSSNQVSEEVRAASFQGSYHDGHHLALQGAQYKAEVEEAQRAKEAADAKGFRLFAQATRKRQEKLEEDARDKECEKDIQAAVDKALEGERARQAAAVAAAVAAEKAQAATAAAAREVYWDHKYTTGMQAAVAAALAKERSTPADVRHLREGRRILVAKKYTLKGWLMLWVLGWPLTHNTKGHDELCMRCGRSIQSQAPNIHHDGFCCGSCGLVFSDQAAGLKAHLAHAHLGAVDQGRLGRVVVMEEGGGVDASDYKDSYEGDDQV